MSGEHDGTGRMDCDALVELVTEYLEGAMSADDAARFDAHLAECSGCAEYVDQIRLTIQVAGGLEPPMPTGDPEAVVELFRDWKRGREEDR